jgi:hypothetical protein
MLLGNPAPGTPADPRADLEPDHQPDPHIQPGVEPDDEASDDSFYANLQDTYERPTSSEFRGRSDWAFRVIEAAAARCFSSMVRLRLSFLSTAIK